jgi:hypothetical protein
MRKITQQAVNNFYNAKVFKSDNTNVIVKENVTILKLYNTEIAYLYNDPQRTLSITNGGYETNTTKERLNALNGVSIQQKKGIWYLNGNEWNGKLIDIKK